MGNWQERVRQAEEEKRRKIVQQNTEAQQKLNVQKTEKAKLYQERRIKWESKRQELLPILKQFKAEELLSSIRDDEVWGGVGNIIHEGSKYDESLGSPPEPRVSVALTYEYRTAKWFPTKFVPGRGLTEQSMASIEGGYTDSEYRISPVTTKLAIAVKSEGFARGIFIPSAILVIEDNDAQFHFGIDVKELKAHQLLEDGLLQSLIARKKKDALPFQLKRRGEDEIRRLIPWRKRLF